MSEPEALVRVPVTGGRFAVLTAFDHAQLLRMGYGGTWFLRPDSRGRLHVRCGRADGSAYKPAYAWRVVLRDATGWRGAVLYRDGNPLNLIPANVLQPEPRWMRSKLSRGQLRRSGQ